MAGTVETYPSWIDSLSDDQIRASMIAADVGGTVSEAGMAALFQNLVDVLKAENSTLSATQFADLKTIAANLNVGETASSYLTYITRALVDGNPANATFTGGQASASPLGDLAVDATATQIQELADKWLYGTDLPRNTYVGGIIYAPAPSDLPLFAGGGPSMDDINQGNAGDCYFESALAEIAYQNPSLITSMFVDNGNGSYGVRFYVNGSAEWVTVSNQLANAGTLLNRDPGALWASLAEQAYAQLQGNDFNAIARGGYGENALEQLTGVTQVTDYTSDSAGRIQYVLGDKPNSWGFPNVLSQENGHSTASVLSRIVSALATGDDVLLASAFYSYDASGKLTLVDEHEMSIYGYDGATGMLEIRNPWGTQPPQTWDTTFEVSLKTLFDPVVVAYFGSRPVSDWVTIDNVGDKASAISDSAATTGPAGDHYINGANFNSGATTLTGVAAPSEAVTLDVLSFLPDGEQAAPLSTVALTADGNGEWTYTLSNLADGSAYTVEAKSGGGTTADYAFTVKLETSESPISDSALVTGSDGKLYLDAAHFNGGATTLTGQAESGDKVTVSVNGSSEAATMADDGSGDWTFTATDLMNGQTYTAVATAIDAAGNQAQSAPFTFTVKTTAQVGAISDAAVTVGADGKNYINAANLSGGATTLTGTAEPRDAVTLSVSSFFPDGSLKQDFQTAPVKTGEDGSWSDTLTGLQAGLTYMVTATATDSFGNTATSGPFVFTASATSESAISAGGLVAVTSRSYIGYDIDGSATTLVGKAEAGDTVAIAISVNATDQTGQATVAADGSWTYALTDLVSGESYTVAATATDALGDTASSGPLTFVVDAPHPSLPPSAYDSDAFTGANGITYVASTTTRLQGSSYYSSNTLTYSVNGGPAQPVSVDPEIPDRWGVTLSGLVNGETYAVALTATDAQGDSATGAPFVFTVDTSAVEGPVSDPAVTPGSDGQNYIKGANFNGGVTTISGQAAPDETVWLWGESATAGPPAWGSSTTPLPVAVNPDGSWNYTIAGLVNGQNYIILAEAKDPYGHEAYAPISFTVKTGTTESAISDPDVTQGSDGANYINAAHFNSDRTTTLSGTAEAGDTVTVSVNGSSGAATMADDGSGDWTFTATGLVNGQTYTAIATATDAAGNEAQGAFSFTVDTNPSFATISKPAETIGTDGKAYVIAGATTIGGTATPGDTGYVSFALSSRRTGENEIFNESIAINADGSWSLPLSGLYNNLTVTATVSVTDTAGNTATSDPITFTAKSSTIESVISDSDVFTVTIPGAGSQNFIDAQATTGTTTLTGQAEAGDSVTVSVNGGPEQPATMAANGSWTYQLDGLTDGTSYVAVATATDAVGDTASSAPYSFTIGVPPISISRIFDPATRGFLGGNYLDLPYLITSFTTTLTGKATPGASVTLSVNGGTPQATSTADDGSWTFTLSGNEHVYTMVATATDSAGDTAVSSPFTFTTAWLRSYRVVSFLRYQSTFDQFAGGFNVGDTAHNIGAAFDQLADTHIVWIKISDNAAVTLTARQVVSDAEAIGKLQNANGSPPAIAITDTAANVATNLDALQALAAAGELAAITLTDQSTPVLT
ncbi:MAG: hypothetical protein C5B56_07740, partial [Proteobacteria bacterium]